MPVYQCQACLDLRPLKAGSVIQHGLSQLQDLIRPAVRSVVWQFGYRDVVQVMQEHIKREAVQDVDRQLESSENAERAKLQACSTLFNFAFGVCVHAHACMHAV